MKNGFDLYHHWLLLLIIFFGLAFIFKLLSDRVSKKYRKGLGTLDSSHKALFSETSGERVRVRFLKVFTALIPYLLIFFLLLLAVVVISQYHVKVVLFLSISSLLVLLLCVYSAKQGDFDWSRKDHDGAD